MNIATPTPIPIDNLPFGFREYVYGFFGGIINAFKAIQVPFTHATVWDFLIWTLVLGATLKAIKLMYGKGDASKHE